jgi:hypothetical protein
MVPIRFPVLVLNLFGRSERRAIDNMLVGAANKIGNLDGRKLGSELDLCIAEMNP